MIVYLINFSTVVKFILVTAPDGVSGYGRKLTFIIILILSFTVSLLNYTLSILFIYIYMYTYIEGQNGSILLCLSCQIIISY